MGQQDQEMVSATDSRIAEAKTRLRDLTSALIPDMQVLLWFQKGKYKQLCDFVLSLRGVKFSDTHLHNMLHSHFVELYKDFIAPHAKTLRPINRCHRMDFYINYLVSAGALTFNDDGSESTTDDGHVFVING